VESGASHGQPGAGLKPGGSDPLPDDPAWLQACGLEVCERILCSHRQVWGQPLLALPADASARLQAQELFAAEVVVLAHDAGPDPRLIYANRAALRLWRRSWAAMVGMPSRLTAAAAERPARSGALAEARERGGIDGYRGIRVDSSGRRFQIEAARLWTLHDDQGTPCGQAAGFARWWWL